MHLDLDIGSTSHPGPHARNEDWVAAHQPPPGAQARGAIAAIADGVSAGGLGWQAAQTAVTSVVRDYYATPATWDTTVALDRILTAHNAWWASMNRRCAPRVGMCTLTALVLRGHGYALAHVGDSRAYLWRAGTLQLLTSDHVVPHHDLRHRLTRALGADERVVVDYLQGDVQVGDTFVLLTDGVHGVLREHALAQCLGQQDLSAQGVSDALVHAALAAATRDNASALVVRVRGLPAQQLQDAQRAAQHLPVPARLPVGDCIDGLRVRALVADNGVHLLYEVEALAGAATPSAARYALKTLHPERARDPLERANLAHEGWLAHCMHHTRAAEHLVRLHPHPPGRAEPGYLYLLYDWHPGRTLEQVLQQDQPLSARQCVELALQALHALAGLHRQGVVHRDIKPGNLHLGEDGVLRVLDLGVALSGREDASMRSLHAGTPSYINPEQWGFALRVGGVATDAPAQPPDPGSDLFAVGVTLYQLLTGGKLPYGEVLPYQSGRYFRDPLAPSRHRPEVPIWLDHVALKAVARDQRLRFETAEEFALALERGAARPLTVPPPSPLLQRDPSFVWKLATGLLGLVNLLLVYWLLWLPKQ